jgi:diguanylate cyclase
VSGGDAQELIRMATKGAESTRGRGKLALLRKADLFQALDAPELSLVARYSGYQDFSPGEPIFPEGSTLQELFLIKEGSVAIRKREEGGEEKDVARFLAGEVFGEMDLLDTVPRDAAALAETAATLLIFPARGLAFRDILERHPVLSARILHKLLGFIAGKIRAADRLLSEKTPWIQELKRQLQRDKLTGLYNRAFLEEELAGIIAGHTLTSLLVVKPDNFKTINDTYGHDAGDRALVLLAAAVKSRLGEGALGVRYRGDEFCAVLPDAPVREAEGLAREIITAVDRIDLAEVTGGGFRMSASVGVVTSPGPVVDARTLIARGFEKMLEARTAGGGRAAVAEAR